MPDADPYTRTSDFSVVHRIPMHDSPFIAITDIASGSHPLIQLQLRIKPGEILLAVPQTGNDPFAVSVDDLGCTRHLNLARWACRRNLIALNDNYGIGYWCAAVSVNQCAALNDNHVLLRKK